MTRLAPPPGSALLTLLMAAACTDAGGFGSDDTGGSDSGPPPVDTLLDDTGEDSATEDSADEEELPEVINPGTLTGTIFFDLYTTDSSGAVEPLVWADWYGDTFPFGTVVVTGYTVDDDGVATYWSTTILPDPSPDGEGYELEFGFDAEHQVTIQASLDYWGDGLIAPYDPSAVYATAVPVAPDGALSGVNITIDVPYYDFSLTGGGYWNPDDWVQVSGDADISEQLADGTCMAMVYDTTGYGPYGYTGFAPAATSAGAEGSYAMWAPKGMGDSQILGACDTNLNGMIEAADAWGGYSEDGDTVATVPIGTENLTDYTLKIPLNAPARASVNYSGRVLLDELTMAQVTGASSLYITAQKYRVSESWDPDASGRTYDYEVYRGSEISDSSPYSLTMPADAVTWLWACLDVDGDGVVNEAGEPCGQPSTDGKIATGSSARTDLEFWIHTMQ